MTNQTSRRFGIVCDDYKVASFERALKVAKLPYTKSTGVSHDTTTITVLGQSGDYARIEKICKQVNATFVKKRTDENRD